MKVADYCMSRLIQYADIRVQILNFWMITKSIHSSVHCLVSEKSAIDRRRIDTIGYQIYVTQKTITHRLAEESRLVGALTGPPDSTRKEGECFHA